MKSIKLKDIKKDWRLKDAKNQILGRLSSEIAILLMGKNKAIYTPNLDTGDYVVVINSQKVRLSGKKENQKKYYSHSQYPGGLKSQTAAQIRNKNSDKLIRNAVVGMLPKTKMGSLMAKKLFIYPDENHPFVNKFKKEN